MSNTKYVGQPTANVAVPRSAAHIYAIQSLVCAAVLSAACAHAKNSLASLTQSGPPPTARAIHLEAEQGELAGTVVQNNGSGFSGTGYVGGFEAQNTAVRFHNVRAQPGIYEARVRFRAPSEKGIDLSVNGKKTSAMIPASPTAFATKSLGKIELKAGSNEIAIERGWGYFQIDALDLVPAPPLAPLQRIKPILADSQASPEARRVMAFLTEHYGTATLSGQQNVYDADFVQKTTGKSPAIVGCDLIDYSPSRVARSAHPETTTEQMLGIYRSGHLLSVMWHWNAPKNLLDKKYKKANGQEVDASWYRGFYTEATTFDVAAALANPKGEDYRLLLRDIDVIAAELKKLQNAHVPVLWRPLHEAEGGWFWWGAKGPDAFKSLWRLMYNRFTRYHGLHNLIWVYTSGGKKDWYPGDNVVDVVGVDAYPSDVADPLSGTWDELLTQFDGRKVLALTEFGGVPDTERMRKFGVRWAYFASWGGNLGPKKVAPTELARLYKQSSVLNKKQVVAAVSTLPTSHK